GFLWVPNPRAPIGAGLLHQIVLQADSCASILRVAVSAPGSRVLYRSEPDARARNPQPFCHRPPSARSSLSGFAGSAMASVAVRGGRRASPTMSAPAVGHQ